MRLAPPPLTRRIPGAQSLTRVNRQIFADFARLIVDIGRPETPPVALFWSIRQKVSVGVFRGQFLGPMKVRYGKVGQAALLAETGFVATTEILTAPDGGIYNSYSNDSSLLTLKGVSE